MANLNFKWGNHANLPAQLSTDQIGSLFFTKDEGALYLGVEAGKKPQRIQGVVQYYADLAAFKADVLPPYSEDVIYYIASENALVKWHGAKVSTDGTIKEEGKFTILNVTASEFGAKVSDLASDISTNAGNIGTNTTNITNLKADLGNSNDTADKETAFGRIADLEAAVTALEKFTGVGSGDNSLSSRIGTLETWKTTASGEISSLQGDVSTMQGDIGTAKTDIANLKTATETNATNIGVNAAAITSLQNVDNGILTRLGTAETDIDNAEQNIGQNAADIVDLQSKVANKVDSSVVTTLSGRVDTIVNENVTRDQNITNNANGISAINNKIGGEFSATNTVAKAIADVAGDVVENQGKIGTNTEDIKDLKELTEDHSEAINGIGVEISGIKEADIARDGKISALESWKTTAAQKITDLEGDVSDAQADATSALNKFSDYYTKTEADGKHTDLKNSLETKLANEINAANALKYIKGIGSDSEWNAVKAANAAIGHTYVVTESNIYLDLNGTSTVCNAGDLLIATAASGKTETNGVLAGADIVWIHVKSGYQEELQSQLRVVDGDTDAAKKASIQLTSYPAAQAGNYGDKGIINIVADSNNLEVTVNNKDVKIAMVWDTF